MDLILSKYRGSYQQIWTVIQVEKDNLPPKKNGKDIFKGILVIE